MDRQHKETERVFEILVQQQKQINKILEQIERTQKQIERTQKQIEKNHIQLFNASKYASESVWAAIFNNTISNSKWLGNKSFAPGRWAVGYGFLYVMYRVLNEMHPKHILELGLGQTTKLISQYIAATSDAKHYVVEGDPNWIEFFCNTLELAENTEIVCLNYEMVSYKEAEKVRVFGGFKEKFEREKFDFISIDAPWGGDMKQYSRIDILDLLPDCIDENFVIMIDDCERSGERNTVEEIERRLQESGILYKIGRYYGKRDFILITAEHMRFLTSM